MARKITQQVSFNAGELSPRLYSRIDVGKYDNGLKTATNASLYHLGPIYRRQGSQYLASVKDNSKTVKLARFQFNLTTGLVLEMGDAYIRFFSDGAAVNDTNTITNGTFDSDISGWTDNSSGTGSIAHTTDHMDLVGVGGGNEARAYQILTNLGTNTYTVTATTSAALTYNVGTSVGATDIATGSINGTAQTFTFTPSTHGNVYLEFENANSDTRELDDVSIDTPVYQIDSPYLEADLPDVSYTQEGSTMYFAHKDYPPRKLTRTANDNWTFSLLSELPPPSYESGYQPATTVTPGATSGTSVNFTAGTSTFLGADVGRQIVNLNGNGRASITSITSATVAVADILTNFDSTDAIPSGDWEMDLSPICDLEVTGSSAGSIIELRSEYSSGYLGESFTITGITQANPGVVTTSAAHGYSDGDQVQIKDVLGMTQVNGNVYTVNQLTPTTFQLRDDNYTAVDTTNYTAYASGGTARQLFTGLGIDTFRAADIGRFVLLNGGVVEILSVTNAQLARGEVLKSLNDKNTTGNWTLETETWTAARGYPRCTAVFQDRLLFGGTIAQPQTIWMSETGIFDGFGIGPDDDDSIEITLSSSQANEINWMAVTRDLVVGTSGGEITVDSGNTSSGSVAPSSVRAIPRRYSGSDVHIPVVINSEVLFIQNSQRKVRSFLYNFEIDGYTADDLHELSEHITEGKLKEIAYAQEPNSQIYAVTEDGDMLVGTYVREQKALGWTKFTTDGTYENVMTLDGSPFDRVYVVVKRTVNGATKRYVELFDTGDGTDRLHGYSDSFLTYSAPKTITGITQANPGVVTAASHGFSDGDKVKLIDVGGMTEVENTTYIVANKTTNTFELTNTKGVNVDTTSNTAYTSGGEAHKLVTTISGLDHLEAATVQVKSDGAKHPDKTVSSGSITLDSPAYEVVVGLSYTTTIETLDLNFDIGLGTMKGQRSRWARPQLEVYKSVAPTVNDQIVPARSGADLMDKALGLRSEILEYGPFNWANNAALTITLSDPFPLVLTGLFGTVQAGVK